MSITTTESLRQSPPLRCGRCGRETRGLLIGGLGECCAKAADKVLMAEMLRTTPEPEPTLPAMTAADPFQAGRGASPLAVRVLAGIRTKYARAKSREEAERYRQAHPEAVAEVLAEGLPVPLSEPLNLPSIPPPWAPDPLLADIRPPLRSGRMARREARQGPLAALGHDGRVDHVSPRERQDRNPWSAREIPSNEELG